MRTCANLCKRETLVAPCKHVPTGGDIHSKLVPAPLHSPRSERLEQFGMQWPGVQLKGQFSNSWANG